MAGARRRTRSSRSAPRRSARARPRRGRRGHSPWARSLRWLRPSRLVRLRALDQRARDVLGLALLALGIFAGFVLDGGWDGGGGGHALESALGLLLGRARVLAPLALVAGGAALLLAPLLAARAQEGEGAQPRNTRLIGAICLFASLTLALAAGMAGISAPRSGAPSTWSSSFLHAHGGVVGEALYALANRLVSQLGVDILVVFLMLAGGTLVTGASLPGAIRALARVTAQVLGVAGALAAGRKRTFDGEAAAADAPELAEAARAAALAPPEPSEQELIVRSTHLEGPSQETAEFPARELRGTGEQDGQRRQTEGRPRLRARGDRHPHPRADTRQAGGGRRGSQRPPAHRAPRGRLPGAAAGLLASHRVAGKGRGGKGDRCGPRQDAAPARRWHHRSGQVGRHQLDALERPAARHAARRAARARRPQAGRAQSLRVDPAPADAGDHEPAHGGERAAEPRQGDGAALRDHVVGAHARPARAQPRARATR